MAALMWTSSGAAMPPGGDPPPTDMNLDLPGASLASSGPALAAGMDATVDERNSQSSACVALEAVCTSVNGASLFVVAEPASPVEPAVPTLPSRPGGGGPPPGGTSGGAGSNSSRPSAGSGRSSQHSFLAVGGPSGSTTAVDPWAEFPGRRLPPLPKQAARAASGSTVSQDPWATSLGADLSPPPAPPRARSTGVADVQPVEIAAVQTRPLVSGGGQIGRATPPGVVAPVAQPPLALIDLDPWAVWQLPPGTPTPAQAAHSAPTELPVATAEPLAANQAIAELPPSRWAGHAATATPLAPSPLVPFLLWSAAFLGSVAASTRRGRGWLNRHWQHWLKGAP
jgi:hypothetical protein